MKRIVGKNQKTIRKRAVSLLLALFLIFSPFESMAFATGETEENRANNSSPVIGQDHPTQPGQVMLFKEAKKVPGMVNTFDVTLRMEAKDVNKTSDIVLVIDTSGSMNQNQRMRRAREAANAFVDRLLPSSTTRIAVVSFAGEVYTKQTLTNNQNALHSAINGLAANGGTFTQAGIKRAREILSNSQADFKHIVLLSDGEPTYSYQIGNGYNASTYFSENIDPNIDIPEQAFTNTRIGYGNALTWPRRNPTHNNGNNAIAESKYAKNAAQSIWTIGLETNNIGDQVMGAVASPGQFYHGTPEELNTIFGEIAGKISSAMKNAHVTDSMGVGFEIPVGEVSNIQAIPANPAPTYNTSETPHKLLWNPGTITTPIAPGSDVKYAQLKYRVVINDNILKLGKPEDGMYNTNSSASVTYVDIDGNTQTSSFPQPNVNPIIIEMKKVLKDSQGNVIPETDQREFNFNLKLQEDGSFNQNYPVKSNAARIMTDLRFDKHYTLTENGFSGTPASTQSDYDINVEWKTWNNTQSGQGSGNSLSNWKIPKGPDGAPLNTTITVTNQEKADGKLTITKKFNPILPEGEIMGGKKRPLPELWENIRASFGGNESSRVKNRDGEKGETYQIQVIGTSFYNNETVYSESHTLKVGVPLVLENLPYGDYTVTEPGKNPGFEDDYGDTEDGKVRIDIEHKERSVTVINFPNYDDDKVDLIVKKIWVGGKPADAAGLTFDLYQDDVLQAQKAWTVMTSEQVSDHHLPAAQANETYYLLEKQQKWNTNGEHIKYEVKEKNVPAGFSQNTEKYKLEEKAFGSEAIGLGASIVNRPEVSVKVTKKWTDADKLDRSGVKLNLYRREQGENGYQKVAGADEFIPSTVKPTNNETHTWSKLPLFSENQKQYEYFVREEFIDSANINNQNWTITEYTPVNFSSIMGGSTGTATVNNVPVTGDENLGKLTVTKKPLVNGAGVRKGPAPAGLRGALKFSFKVTGPAGYEETFELAPGTSKTLTGLYFGEYTVKETDTQGYTASYSVANGKVTLKATDKDKTVEVTNTSGGAGTVVDKTVEKVWVNGPKPSVTIELWRKNNVEGADKIDEKVDEFVVPANASGDALKKTFTKLAKHDSKGNEFEYYVKEENVPANYTKKIEGLKVTNSYTQPTDGEVEVTKVWTDPAGKTLPKPDINLTLYRKVQGGAEEKVPGADIKVVNGNVTTAKWTKLETTDKDGKPYSFIVKESFKNPGDINNGNWTLVESTNVVNGKATITNKAVTGDENLGKLTVTKKPLVNGAGVRKGPAPAGLRGALKFSFKVTGPAGYEETFELAPGTSKTLTGLYFGEYTVKETDTQGYTASYSVANGKVTLKATDKDKTVEVTNTSGGAGTVVDKTVEKVWVNGPKPSVTIELWRKNNVEGADKIDEKVDEFVVPANASGDALKKTFTKLAKHDSKGNEFEYYVKEENVPANYTKKIEGLKVTNSYTQPTDGEVEVTKVWTDPAGKTLPKPDINLTLYRKVQGGAEEKVPGADIKVVNGNVTTAKWTKLETTDKDGKPYSFIVKESFKNPGDINNGNWTLVESTNVVNGKATITNKAVTGDENLGKLTVTKKPLVNGAGVRKGPAPAGLRGALKFSFKVTGPAGYEETFELAPGTSKTLTGLYFGEYTVKETDTQGYTASYSVANGKVTLKATDKDKTVEVTNTSGGAGTVVDKTVEKVWVNGPKPSVTIELWRKNNVEGADKIDEKVDEFVVPANASGDALKKTFTKLAKHDSKGNEFEYYVKEENVPANYTKKIEGLKVTNSYTQPTDGEVEVTKVWTDPAGKTLPKPDINLTLYRKVQGGAEEKVPGADIKVVNGNVTTAKWTKLETTDKDGKPYSFIVKESFKNPGDINNGNWTLVESTNVVNGKATITNKAVTGDENLGKLTVTKKPLVNGAGVRKGPAPAGLRGALKFSFKVTGPAGYEETFELAPGTSKTLTGLYFGEYTVKETDTQGYTASYSVANGKVTLKATDKDKTVEVTNTSGGAGTVVDKTVEKVWVNGPKPSVTIELWRKNNVEGADKIDEKVDEFVVPANASGDALKKTFTKLAKHDSKGNEFEYYVKEENVPANYTKKIEGLKVTNSYTQPTDGEVEVTKVWTDPAGKTLPKPDINLTLYRKVQGGAEEKVPGADIKVVNGNVTTAKWTKLETTDKDGKPYSFIVKESFKNPGDINNGNWTLVESTNVVNGKATITNKAVTGDENLGKLTVTKKPLVNGAGVRKGPAPAGLRGALKFSFKVTGPAGYEETFELAPGTSKTLTGLYFGEYTVKETDTQGYTASYSVANGKVTLKATDKDKTVEVTNTSGGAGTVVDKTVEKVWVNGPKPSVTIELWRKNNVEGADKIDEKVDEFVVPANASGDALKKTFTKLAKHDSKGNEFEYYVKEENVPANYTKKIEGLKVTNTYDAPKINVEATKIWVGGPAADHTQVELLLKRKSAAPGAVEETVPKTPTVTGANPFNYTWENVEAKDNAGYNYTYSVEEKGVTDGKITTPSGNTYKVTQNIQNGKHTITNTYEIPKKNVEAVKTWVGGPAGDHTQVELLLKRKSAAPGAVEQVVNKEPIKSGNGEGPFFYKWENVEQKDDNGYDYTYSVEEENITPEGTVIVHGRTYKVTQQENAGKHIITNSYDAGTKFIATKTWVGGPAGDHTKVTLVLQQSVGGAAAGPVPGNPQPTVTGVGEGPFTYTWENLPTEQGGQAISYSVKEQGEAGGTVTINGRDYTVSYNGSNVVNSYGQNSTKFIATKTWVGGPAGDHTKVTLVLQQSVGGAAAGPVPGNPQPTVTGVGEGPFTYTWENLPTEQGGQAISYSVKEQGEAGGTVTINGRDYTVSYNGSNVVNSYGQNSTKFIATKTWVGGPAGDHTKVTLVLQQSVGGAAAGPVPGNPQPTVTGVGEGPFTYTWENLPTEQGGQAISYSVKEQGEAGGTVTINGRDYTVSYNGSNVVNSYGQNSTKFIATKTWVGGPAGDHTKVTLVLQQSVGGAAAGPVPGNPQPTVTGVGEGPFTYTWENLPTEQGGQAISYSVKEQGEAGGTVTINGRDYTVSYNGSNVVNSYGQNSTKFIATKTWVGGPAGDHTKVTLVLQQSVGGAAAGPVPGNPQPTVTGVGEGPFTYTWENLPTEQGGQAISYSVKEQGEAGGTVTINGRDYTVSYNGSNVVNSYGQNSTKFIATKTWVGGPAGDHTKVTLVLQQSVGGAAAGPVPGNPQPTVTGVGEGPFTYTWENLPTEQGGQAISYSVKEQGEAGGTVTINGRDYTVSYNGSNVVNSYGQNSTKFIATKTWVGGPAGDHTKVTLVLQQSVGGAAAGPVPGNPQPTVTGVGEGPFTYTWENLPTEQGGQAISYSVKEQGEAGGTVTINGRDYTVSYNGSNVVNSYGQNSTKFIATKTWVGGPAGDHTKVTLVLQQSVGGAAAGPVPGNPQPTVTGVGEGPFTYTWENLPTEQGGQAISYSVKEQGEAGGTVTINGRDYTVSYNGSNVVNSYGQNSTKFIATKTWVGGPAGDHTKVTLVLQQSVGGAAAGPVPGNPQPTVTGVGEGPFTYTWENLPTEQGGQAISYSVKEQGEAGGTVTINGRDYTVSYNGSNVVNSYGQNSTKFIATKTWVGGPAGDHTKVTLVLQQSVGGAAAGPVPGNPQPTVTGVGEGPFTYTWENLPTEQGGQAISYSVKEQGEAGGTVTINGRDYTVSYNGSNVVNSYGQNSTKFIATKTWVGGPAGDHTKVTLVLQQSVGGAAAGPVPGNPQPTVTGVGEGPFTYTWENLPTEQGGQAISYSVKEQGEAGGTVTINGRDYTVSYNGSNVVNSYGQNSTKFIATKTWVGGPAGDHTKVTLVLQQSVGGAAAGPVPGNPQPTVTGVGEGPFTYTWENLPTEQGGQAISYSVKEQGEAGGTVTINGRDYTVSYNGSNVVNSYGQNSTKFIATKTWVGGPAGDHTKVTLVLQQSVGGAAAGPVPGNPQPTVTGVGEGPFTYTWENLPTEQGGQAISYSVKEQGEAGGTVTINGRDYTVSYNGSNVVNSYGQNSTKFIATKTWVGGPAGDHTKVTLVLQQSVGGAAAGPVPGNPQPTVTGVGEGPFTYTWENLPTEQGGQAISYSVKEQGEAGGTVTINGRDYTVSYNGSNVVNSTDANTPPSPGGFGGTGGPGEPIDITAKKVWDDSKAEESVNHPTIWFKLYRSLRGSMEPVPGAEIKALTPGVTEVTWHGIEKVNASGETYTFEVKEVDATGFDFTPEGYEKSENGLTVTNTYKGETEGKTDRIAGQKFWILDDPAQRPSAVTVILYRDGEEIARKIITAQEDWKYDFGEHVIEEEDGTKHVYTIGEVVPDGYQMIRHKQYSLVNMGSRGTKDPAIPTVPVLKMKRLPRAGAMRRGSLLSFVNQQDVLWSDEVCGLKEEEE